MEHSLIKKVSENFNKIFKKQPILVFSPGRINLIGEHTDYNDGFVFPAAVDKGMVLALQKSDTNKSSVFALNLEEFYEFDLASLLRISPGGWQNYIIGVAEELKRRGAQLQNFNAVFAGNIPSGAGMSSSAALENSFVLGLNELFDLGLSKREMVLVSQSAEHNHVGVECGIMDQYASMFGVENCALLLDCRTIESETFKIDFGAYELMLINTNVKHDLSESAYNDRRSVCEMIAAKLNVDALRDVTEALLQTIKSEVSTEDYNKALYILEENARVLAFSEAIKTADLQALGILLYESHSGLRNMYEVSCDELDFLVDNTKDNPNILGARMMGGGFGGCTINLISTAAKEGFKNEISKAYRLKFGKACSVYSVTLSNGTRIIKSSNSI